MDSAHIGCLGIIVIPDASDLRNHCQPVRQRDKPGYPLSDTAIGTTHMPCGDDGSHRVLKVRLGSQTGTVKVIYLFVP